MDVSLQTSMGNNSHIPNFRHMFKSTKLTMRAYSIGEGWEAQRDMQKTDTKKPKDIKHARMRNVSIRNVKLFRYARLLYVNTAEVIQQTVGGT